jgi:ribosomal protein S1
VVKEGDALTLRVIKIDPERRRIGLSRRKVDSAAYADLDWKMALSDEVDDDVRRYRNFRGRSKKNSTTETESAPNNGLCKP